MCHHRDVKSGTVRYADDAGNEPDVTWGSVIADHGDEIVTGIYVTTGAFAGADLTATLRTLGADGSVVRSGQLWTAGDTAPRRRPAAAGLRAARVAVRLRTAAPEGRMPDA